MILFIIKLIRLKMLVWYKWIDSNDFKEGIEYKW